MLLPVRANASCPKPDWLDVKIQREPGGDPQALLSFKFGWNGDGDLQLEPVPGCLSTESFELEFIIITDTAKCFAQPPGGVDESLRPDYVDFDLPDSGYVDVWNYSFDYNVPQIMDVVKDECAQYGDELGLLGAVIADWFDELKEATKGNGIEDKHANFAVGAIYSSEFLTDIEYGADYTLDIPPGCSDDDDGWGYVLVSMSTFLNDCSLPGGFDTKCPHFTGFKKCRSESPEGVRTPLVSRLCAPTDWVDLTKYGALGSSYLDSVTGRCEDLDGDQLFGIQQPLPVWGTRARDCNDNPIYGATVDDSLYNDETLMCGVEYACEGGACSFGFCDEGLCNTACNKCYDWSVSETECGDILDNDFDALVDCADPDCEAECCADPGFFDVAPMDWYYSYIKSLVCEGVLDNDEMFYFPESGANRAEFLKINLLLAYPNINFDNYIEFALVYPDVSANDWFAPYVGFATKFDIVKGYPDDTFKPGNVINRAEAAEISVSIYKGWQAGITARYNQLGVEYLELKGAGQYNGQEYTDVRWSKLNCMNEQNDNLDLAYEGDCWFYHPVYTLKAFDGAACGKSINNEVFYDPGAPVTRAETAKIACIVSGVCTPEVCAN